MISNLRVLVFGLIVSIATVAAAQSPVEDAARQQAKQLPFLIATSRQCAAFEISPAPLMQTQYMKDSFGRINSARNEYGHEFAFEYIGDSKVPVAIIGYGQRMSIDQSAPIDQQTLEVLRARAILYNQVKRACGIVESRETPLQGDDGCPIMLRGEANGICPGGAFPNEWLYSSFWLDTWMPTYQSAPVLGPNPVCMQQCQTFCADTKGSFDIACMGLTVFMGTIATPVAAGLVGIACAAGSHVGGMVCRDQICWRNC